MDTTIQVMNGNTQRTLDWQQPEDREELLDLCAAATAGDRLAQRRIVEHIFNTVTGTVSYALNCRIFAEDTVQDSLLEVLDSLRYFRGDCSLTLWARKITLRAVARRVKKQRRRDALMVFAPERRPVLPEGETYTSNRELRIQLNALLMSLPLHQQNALRLRYVHEHSIREIAAIMDAPEETVRDRIKTGKKRLRKLMTGNPAFERLWEEGSSE
jgi:RNA polymerase sigma-70 factor (ECF subfamily)